jgi:hypothetical protein
MKLINDEQMQRLLANGRHNAAIDLNLKYSDYWLSAGKAETIAAEKRCAKR